MKRLARSVRGATAAIAFMSTFAGAKAANAACLGRPTDPEGFAGFDYAGAEVNSFAGAKVRVHYATTGTHQVNVASTRPDNVPDSVAFAVETGDKALEGYAKLGFNAIPSDEGCTSNGGDALLDIYLVKFTSADGSAHAECNAGKCSSFALIESTFQGHGYATPEEGFRTVVSHELFHAVQNTYKPADAPFWAEGTAQWGMFKVEPKVKDFVRQMPAFFSDPTRSIDAPPAGVTSGFLYGSAVWPLFLSLRHGDAFVRRVFEIEAMGGKDPIVAIDEALRAKGSSMADEYPRFAAWNIGTGKQKSTGGYPDAALYPGQRTEPLKSGLSEITSGLGYFAYKGTLSAEAGITLDTDETRNAGVVVPIVDDVLQLDQLKKLPANASGTVLVVVSGITTKKSDAKFTLAVGEPVVEAPPDAGTASSSSGASGASGNAVATVPEDEGCRSAAPAKMSWSSTLSAGIFWLLFVAMRRRRS